MARGIACLAGDRATLRRHAAQALRFARVHDFETEFSRRMLHRAERPWERLRHGDGGERTLP